MAHCKIIRLGSGGERAYKPLKPILLQKAVAMNASTPFFAAALLVSAVITAAPAFGQSPAMPVLKPNQLEPIAPARNADLIRQKVEQLPADVQGCLTPTPLVETGPELISTMYGTPTCSYLVVEARALPGAESGWSAWVEVPGAKFRKDLGTGCTSAVIEGFAYSMDEPGRFTPYVQAQGAFARDTRFDPAHVECRAGLRLPALSGRTRFIVRAWNVQDGVKTQLPLDWFNEQYVW